jgi:hypothetical protein
LTYANCHFSGDSKTPSTVRKKLATIFLT